MFSANSSQVSDDKLFVEDVFSTYLYTGNGSTQTITNGIDLAGKGGLVWIKRRNAAFDPRIWDTVRGRANSVATDLTDAQTTDPIGSGLTSFNSNGFSLGPASSTAPNLNTATYASWTFRKAPKFFDVVTYTGTGSFFRDLSHSLGVAPGFIVVKRTDTTSNWWTYHRGVVGSINGYLNLTDAFNNIGYVDPSPTPAATFRVFNTGAGDDLNVSGATYVAYLYAHDATSDGFIQCGSYTGNGSATGPIIDLGWEPQWVMIKNASGTGNWQILDNMRGMPVGTADAALRANLSSAEASVEYASPTATGFQITSTSSEVNTNTSTYVYIAIRRGPMRTPTLGTSVFAPISRTGTGSSTFVSTSGFPSDNYFVKRTDGGGSSAPGFYFDRLRGGSSSGYGMSPTSTAAENSIYQVLGFNAPNNNGVRVGNVNGYYDASGSPYVDYHFRRAPGFFDTVCYAGTGANRTINHNLGVAPELMIVKVRSTTSSWYTYNATIGAANALALNVTNASFSSATTWNNTAPTATVFTVGTENAVNGSGSTYVAYLFASCPGVSKVGSYTGNGSSQTINCGFAAGARFVMIKRTDSTGDWYVWDTARGIVAGNDPHLSLNTTAAEVTTDDSVDTNSSGFVVNQVAATNVNVNAATYIYLAIA